MRKISLFVRSARTFPFVNLRKRRQISPTKRQFGTVQKLKTVFSPSCRASPISRWRQLVKKRPVTPLSKTPKKVRIDDNDNQWEDIEIVPVNDVDSSDMESSEQTDSINNDKFEMLIPEQTDSINNDKFEMINSAFNVLNDAGLGEQFMAFFELVLARKFPLNNISLLLFLETVRFYNCESTTEMRYSDDTKRFCKSGYRLFHAKFLYFMGGPKHVGEMSKFDVPHKGKYKPEEGKINFAVPSVTNLEKFKVTEVELPGRMPTGVIEPVLDCLAERSCETAYMLCADGKKVTAGVDKAGGDVDMFGYEDGIKLNERKSRLENELKVFAGILMDLKDGLELDLNEKQPIISTRLKECCSVISGRLKDSRELKTRQEYGLSHFKSLGGEKWKESKYVYAISGLQASIYQLNDYIRQALEINKCLCKYIGVLECSIATVAETQTVDIAYQKNMLMLRSEESPNIIESRFLKQRTELWFTLREKALVTGSSIHSALGLRGRKEQIKHIEKGSSQSQTERTEAEEARLRYGTENEINAITTLSSIVLPAYFPSCHYVEEGCYSEPGVKRDVALVVSPDGSIREVETSEGCMSGKAIAAVEVKCPYPKENTLPVQYSLPEYYVCQCLAEMHVLNTSKLIYVSYSKESSTILELTFDEHLWNIVWEYLCEIYDGDSPKVPQKGGQTVKRIKSGIKEYVKSNVKFIVEVPSVIAVDSGVSQTIESLPFQFPMPGLSQNRIEVSVMKQDLIRIMTNAEKSTEICYNLMRRKATEVMVWVLTNVNRNSSTETPCSLPIAYGLKDYKLTTEAMREATNHVLRKCNERGIRVCSFSTDGQWINLMNRNENGDPLTLLQLQKFVWCKVQKIAKQELLKIIGNLNTIDNQKEELHEKVSIERNEASGFTVTSKETCFATIKTSRDKRLWSSVKKQEMQDAEPEKSDNVTENDAESTEWMPEEVIQTLQSSDDQELHNVVSNINNTIYGLTERDDDSRLTITEESNLEEVCTLFESEQTDLESRVQDSITEIDVSGSADVPSKKIDGHLSSRQTESEPTPEPYTTLTQNQTMLETVLSKLKEEPKFLSVNKDQLLEILHSKSKMMKEMTHKQLNKLHEALSLVFQDILPVRKTWKKEAKVNLLSSFLHNEEVNTVSRSERRIKRKTPQSLSKLCINQCKKVPKAVLNAAYASYIYRDELIKWNTNAPIKSNTIIQGHEEELPFWYSYPNNNPATEHVMGNSIDCSHNLTHLRVRSCTTGIGSVSSDAWKAVAASNETRLNVAFVEDLLDKQSVPNARTNFSEEVEHWMTKNGYNEAARVTKIIRDWFEASDTPGICVDDRIRGLVQMRNFLLKDVDFGSFPPPGRYINKIPVVTFEGLMIDIDTKLQLHGYCGPYNIRSVGSLAAETMVGVLQEMSPTQAVSIKARDVPSLISTVVEVMTCKMNPKRCVIDQFNE